MKNDFYSEIEDKRETGGYDKNKIEFLISEIGSGNKILDVACNDGYISEILKNNNNVVFGFDIAIKDIRIARKRGINVKYFKIGSGPFPYKDKQFDVVLLGDIIEHIFDTDEMLRECYRILKPKGKLIITTPNVASLLRRFMLLIGISPFLEYSIELSTNGFPSVGHIRYYTAKTLTKQLYHNNFIVKKLVGNVVFIAPWLRLFYLAKLFPTLSSLLFCVAEKKY